MRSCLVRLALVTITVCTANACQTPGIEAATNTVDTKPIDPLKPGEPPPVRAETSNPHPWPAQPNARWPARCLIENIAVHPVEPWLAVACTDAENERGAVLVFDARAGTLLSSTSFEGYVGWSQSPGVLRWHPGGTRLATNVDTNGIAVVDRARVVGRAFPDETRDSGVRYVWVGDQIFTDTGALFEIHEGDHRLDFDSTGAPFFDDIAWNAATGAVVGRVMTGLAAFDPLRKKLLYQVSPEPEASHRTQRWSADGRWCALVSNRSPLEPDDVQIYNADDGRHQWTVRPSSPQIDDVHWAPDGSLLVRSHRYDPKTRARTNKRLEVVRSGRVEATIALAAREIQVNGSVPEASIVASSPTGEGFALLLDRQELQIFDARSGKALSTFRAPAPPIPAGLPSYYRDGNQALAGFPGDLLWVAPQRLVRLAPHFVAFWSLDGDKVAEFVVPDGG
jgi:hypothetical protein